jgi:hypothetical protein
MADQPRHRQPAKALPSSVDLSKVLATSAAATLLTGRRSFSHDCRAFRERGNMSQSTMYDPKFDAGLWLSSVVDNSGDAILSKTLDGMKRKAEHIEEGYEDRGVGKKEAERRAWATVNKESGGGNKSGSGRGKPENHSASRKGGRKSGSSQSHEKRSAAAKKGWETRRSQARG